MRNMERFEPDNSRNLPNTGQSSAEDPGLELIAMSLQNSVAIPLLGYGEVVVGRALDADVPLADPRISHRHARLTVLPGSLSVEDLGSEAGTFVREVCLPPGQRVGFLLGEPLRVGDTALVVRRRPPRMELRRLWSPLEFSALVEDECLRAHRRLSVFAVAHVALEPGGHRLSDLIAQVDQALPPPHMLGAAPAGGLQALLVAIHPMLMSACLRRLARSLREQGYGVRLGLAWFPGDARTSASLQGLARHRARPASPTAESGISR
jgi:pSer/pThr/pTyr-binding forkhead associated (FHA) protein